ncbi:MAG: divalent metal cation transporter, partial [Patescibacteria group bacterium]
FWQNVQEIEESPRVNHLKITNRSVTLGFIYSGLVAFFIMVASASAIADHSLASLNINDIAEALRPLAGPWATKLFGLGLIGSGLLAIPILAIASSYAVAEYFNWPGSLKKKPSRAKGFYTVITFGFIICLLALFSRLDPIKIMFYSQALVGAVTPLFIFYLMRLAHSRKIMKGEYSHWLNYFAGWLTIALLVAGDICFIYLLWR